jgi:transposase
MKIKLHANARTTPRIRQYIKESPLSVRELAKELGISENTVRKWKDRESIEDRSHTRHNLNPSTSCVEEELIVELRQHVRLSLNDITEVMKRCVNETLSRSSIRRCLVRNNALTLEETQTKADKKAFDDAPFGYVHCDLKFLSHLEKKESYVFVAIERTTRFVYVEIIDNRRAETVSACFDRFIAQFPGKIHTVLTDNGSEFTDRFGGTPEMKGTVTGNHVFDKVCVKHHIKHRLTKPYSPQTNGMVERFNRRISDALKHKNPIKPDGSRFFSCHEREVYIKNFVYCYNRTRLTCLGYISPFSALNNQKELYRRLKSRPGEAAALLKK